MKKLFLLILILSASAYASDRPLHVVGVSGFGTGEAGAGQPSGAHDNLPKSSRISSTTKFTHHVSKSELQNYVKGLNCEGLMVMANSWGSAAGHRLASIYQEECGSPVELFIMVDGVSKPIGPFKKLPPAHKCMNYFQRKSTVRGNAIQGCENQDLSTYCRGAGIGTCHVEVEWMGTNLGKRMMENLLNSY